MPLYLNLANWLPRSRANGPGTRMVIWVQGCPFRCKGCQNPDYLPFTAQNILSTDDLWKMYQSLPNLDGITFSGGEPFSQAIALTDLAQRVRAQGKTVVCWTGFRLEHLQANAVKGATELLNHIDLLIDGTFQADRLSTDPLRGSTNQQLHFLSDRLSPDDLHDIPRQEWVLSSHTATYTGFPLT